MTRRGAHPRVSLIRSGMARVQRAETSEQYTAFGGLRNGLTSLRDRLYAKGNVFMSVQ